MKANALVAEADPLPVLMSYSADGTPLKARYTQKLGSGETKVIRKQAFEAKEFLVQ